MPPSCCSGVENGNSEFFAKDKVGTDKADHPNKISIGGGFQEF